MAGATLFPLQLLPHSVPAAPDWPRHLFNQFWLYTLQFAGDQVLVVNDTEYMIKEL